MIETIRHLIELPGVQIVLGALAATMVYLLIRIMTRVPREPEPEPEPKITLQEVSPSRYIELCEFPQAVERSVRAEMNLKARLPEDFPTPPVGFDYHKGHTIYREPRYDSEWFLRGENGFIPYGRVEMFRSPRGMSNRRMETKTTRDTNLNCGTMLGTPVAACFQWIKILLEECASEEDAEAFMKAAVFRFEYNYDQLLIERPLSTFEPVGKPDQRRFYATGIKVEPIWIYSTTNFRVSVEVMDPVKVSGHIKVKILLGPWFFSGPFRDPIQTEAYEPPVTRQPLSGDPESPRRCRCCCAGGGSDGGGGHCFRCCGGCQGATIPDRCTCERYAPEPWRCRVCKKRPCDCRCPEPHKWDMVHP